MKLLLQAAIRNRKHLTLAILTLFALLFLTFSNQLEMFSLGIITNRGTDNPIIEKFSFNFDLEKNISIFIGFLVIVACFKAFALFIARYMTQVLSIRITRDLREQFFQHIQSLPLSFYNEFNLGSLTSRAVGDAGQIASSLNSMLINYLQTPFTIVSSLLVCFGISWQLSLIIFLGVPLIIFPIIFFTKKIKKVTRQLQKNQERFTSVLLDFLSGIHTVKIYSMEQFSFRKYKEQNDQMAKLEMKNAKYSLLTRPVLHTVTTTCLVTVLLFGLYTLKMTVSQLITFCGMLYLFYEPVKKFAEENTNVQKGAIAAERMFEVLNLEPKIFDRDGARPLETFENQIEFKNVWFKYSDAWVLKDLSFTIKKGETVAIVGPTGAGKSTIVQLLPRLYDIQKGDILIDECPLKEFTQKSLRDQMAFVPQKPFLFFDTVAENIAFGNSFSLADVQAAAKMAHAHEFIEQLPDKYGTLLAETGKNLSGGQQQRLAIARALMKKVPFLIMDEATSSLDAVSENKIKLAIEQLHGKVTQIIIAHRLSTIEHADKIIYLDQGVKLAEGTKDELLKNCPAFKVMWDTFHKIKQTEQAPQTI
ncbi:MAG: ABC transporter ATP-binding protein [Chlamydiae bacterium CG10_big_fil_rev_8_21_14_0_10_35_9]|nr:MAG: ABC transporter ATP-binding protein [Chlamydiae bacterium CG10_big_fil_rev_8_21_14_0_10_35_9]